MSLLASLFIVLAVGFAAAQSTPAPPAPLTSFCSPNNTNPALTWCKYNNPFILSDFLSRNSSQLSQEYPLEVKCRSDPQYLHRQCTGIQTIRSGTYGPLSNGETTSYRVIIFTDTSGRMLFVNFNTNLMGTIGGNVLNVKHFEAASATRAISDGRMVEDLVVLLGNDTDIVLIALSGDNLKAASCNLMGGADRDVLKYLQQALTYTTFYPLNNVTKDGNRSLVFVLRFNATRLLNLTVNVDPYTAWLDAYYLYRVAAAPARSQDVLPYVQACPPGNPLNVSSDNIFYSTSKQITKVYSNPYSGLTFIVMASTQAINIYRLTFDGPMQILNGSTQYSKNVTLMGSWCDNSTSTYDPFTGESVTGRLRTTVFCVPNPSAIITAMELTSLDPDTMNKTNSTKTSARNMFLAVAYSNSSGSFVHVMDFPELMDLEDLSNSTLKNPLGMPNPYPCKVDVEYFDTKLKTCRPRNVHLLKMTNSTAHISEITSSSQGPQPQLFGNLPNPIPDSFHLNLFISQGSLVHVLSIQGSQGLGGKSSVVVELANSIAFLGNVETIHVSPNSQHLFASISRSDWELRSQTRYSDLCAAYEKNPADPFVKSFGKNCKKYPPQPLNLNTFAQYASYCSYNLYCPSLRKDDIQFPSQTMYAERPGVLKKCPRGSFCSMGQLSQCPPGFFCDDEGLMQPKPCPLDPSSTCSNYATVSPQPCPEGTVCVVPHIPGLPAPPGNMVPAPPSDRSAFLPCELGEWCPLGAQQAYNGSTVTNTTFDCPENTFCRNSSVLEPTICRCDASGNVSDGNGGSVACKDRMMYCPTGTTSASWCPAGYSCTSPTMSVACIASQFCPEGTFAPLLCPAGFFCPDPAQKTICPERYYCPEGSVVPQPCNFLTICAAGSVAQSTSFLAPVVLLLIIIFVLGGRAFFNRGEQRANEKLKKAAEERPSSLARPLIEDTGYLIVDDENAERFGESKCDAQIPTSRFVTPSIRFEKMGLTLEVGEFKGKEVLVNVTGTISPGSFVAVMGPSGSGKSTFMHTLAGKAFYGSRSGRVLVNNDEVNLTEFSKVIGFVKQDDIMLREMTVSETLLFNARMRYDDKSADTPEAITNQTLRTLDLNHVRDTNIGDEKKRGISGGQRKRVNIGMEIVALPCILFLDEPTSGLDSSSSMTVCRALRDMAQHGNITVIAVIHQPRYEIFQMFHQVLLLAKGGKLVYFGEPTRALHYFQNVLEVQCPEHVNPPDFMMDVISGEDSTKRLSIDEMASRWEKNAESYQRSELSASIQQENSNQRFLSGTDLAAEASKKSVASLWQQLYYFTVRSLQQLSRDMLWFFTDLGLVLVAGFFLGLVFSRSNYVPPLPGQIVNKSLEGFQGNPPSGLVQFFNRPVDDPIISEASLTCMAIGMTGVTAALRVFGNEQIVYWREASAGMSTGAYFLAKNLTHIFFIVLSPLLYLTPFLTFVSARADFMDYYLIVLVTQFTTVGLGYFLSIVVPGGLSQLAGIVMILVLSMFGGGRPTLVEIQAMFPLLRIMPYLSYVRFAQEALYIKEIVQWSKIKGVNINPSLNLLGYSIDDYSMCMAVTFAYGIFFRILAYLAMTFMHRDQKH